MMDKATKNGAKMLREALKSGKLLSKYTPFPTQSKKSGMHINISEQADAQLVLVSSMAFPLKWCPVLGLISCT